jgi:23S rRNA (adenine2503-C2)-methyltransferase
MVESRPHLLGMTTPEFEELAVSMGQPKFRGRQIAARLYKQNVSSLSDMPELPASFRERLESETVLHRIHIAAAAKSADGTTKFLLELEDGMAIEAVILPYEERVSVCVSTQVGCAAGCIFCATAIGGLARNLMAGEIVDEVLTLQRESPRRITHVVYMGMGEPLLNYDEVLKSIRILNEEVGIAMRHITVSTVGITPRIEKLAAEKLQITLAISLHAPNDALRRQIMPIAERYPVEELVRACRSYADLTHRRITFEYLLIRGLNDSVSLAHELVELLRGCLCNVNLIPYNAIEGLTLNRPSRARVQAFRSVLEEAGITVTQRVERGHAVSAACGQLRRRHTE